MYWSFSKLFLNERIEVPGFEKKKTNTCLSSHFHFPGIFVLFFVGLFVFEIGSPVFLVGLELSMKLRMTLNALSSCLYLLSGGIAGV